MTQTPQTPAGWYPQGGVERWWDGNAWSDHTRPLPGAQPPQPQPAYQQPGQPMQAQPAYGTPQGYYPTQPPQQSHTARNVLIIIGVVFLLFVGGCVAVGVLITNEVNNVVNDDTPGGPNNPLEIEEGEGFEVAGFEYADGWSIETDASGFMDVQNLKVHNGRGETDQALVEVKLLVDNEVMATSTCSSNDRIPDDITVTLDCFSSDAMPAEYDKITINDAF